MNDIPPYAWTQGLWVCLNTSVRAVSARREASVQAHGLFLEHILVDLPASVHQIHLPEPTSNRRPNGSVRMNFLEARSLCSSVHATDCWPSARSC